MIEDLTPYQLNKYYNRVEELKSSKALKGIEPIQLHQLREYVVKKITALELKIAERLLFSDASNYPVESQNGGEENYWKRQFRYEKPLFVLGIIDQFNNEPIKGKDVNQQTDFNTIKYKAWFKMLNDFSDNIIGLSEHFQINDITGKTHNDAILLIKWKETKLGAEHGQLKTFDLKILRKQIIEESKWFKEFADIIHNKDEALHLLAIDWERLTLLNTYTFINSIPNFEDLWKRLKDLKGETNKLSSGGIEKKVSNSNEVKWTVPVFALFLNYLMNGHYETKSRDLNEITRLCKLYKYENSPLNIQLTMYAIGNNKDKDPQKRPQIEKVIPHLKNYPRSKILADNDLIIEIEESRIGGG